MLLSFFRKSVPSPETECANTLIELVYAGKDMAAHLTMRDGPYYSCVCGQVDKPENPAHHHNFCPVGRFYAAVERVGKLANN